MNTQQKGKWIPQPYGKGGGIWQEPAQTEQRDTDWQICHRFAAHNAWKRLYDGSPIYAVYPIGETPTPTSGGYPLLGSALSLKGLSLSDAEQRDTAQPRMKWEKVEKFSSATDYKAHAERLAEALAGYVVDGDHPEVRQKAEAALAAWEGAQK